MIAKVVLSSKVGGLHWDITEDASYVINPNRIKELIVSGSGSQFKYMFDPESDNGDWAYLISTTTVASLVSSSDDSAHSSFVVFNVFDDDDTTSTPVATYFLLNDIAFAEGYGTEYSWVWLSQGGNRMKRILVYHDLDGLIDIADTGTTTVIT